MLELRRLRAQVGQPSFRDLSRIAERRASSAGGGRCEALPPSTTSEILAGKRLPRMPRLEFVESYVAACLSTRGASEHLIATEVAWWRDAWRSLADTDDPDTTLVALPAATVVAPSLPAVAAPPEPAVVSKAEPVGPVRPTSSLRRRWIIWPALAATFLAGLGVGLAGANWWPVQRLLAASDGSGQVNAATGGTCIPPLSSTSPAGRDVLRLPGFRPAGTEKSTPAGTWRASDLNGIGLQTDGREFEAVVHGGTARPGDLIIIKGDVALREGRPYALAFTARVDRPASIRVRVQDSKPPIYYSSYMKDLPVGTVACRHSDRFIASRTSARSELTFQVGGDPNSFRLHISDVVLVEQDV